MWNDLRQTLSLLIKNPGFSLVVCLTLALGIGANAAMFSVIDAALLRPLPYKNADRLVDITSVVNAGRPDELRLVGSLDEARLHALRAQTQIFDGIGLYGISRRVSAPGADASTSQWMGSLTPGFMEFLGVAPEMGRTFTAADAASGDAVILSDHYWSVTLGRAPEIVGRSVTIGGRAYTVIGVAPPTFRYLVSSVTQTDGWVASPESRVSRLMARLRPGLSVPAAQRALDQVVDRGAIPPTNIEHRAGLDPRARPSLEIEPLDYQRALGLSRSLFFGLLGAVGFVLAIACANVANVLLSRTIARDREVAVRAALGASRVQLARQFLIEGCVLASAGGLIAVVLASWAVQLFPGIVPTNLLNYSLFSVYTPHVDVRLLLFVAVTSIGTGLLSGGASAIRASRVVSRPLMAGGRQLTAQSVGSRRAREGFQALQIAMAFVLLSGAALLANSFVRMVGGDPGFAMDHLQYANVLLPDQLDRVQQEALFERLVARMRTVPGITAITFGTPPADSIAGTFLAEGETPGPDRGGFAMHFISPEYFSVAGMSIKTGRGVTATDVAGAPPVGVIDEGTARQHFGTAEAALGKRFQYGGATQPWTTIVGVVGAVKTRWFNASHNGQGYLSLMQQTPRSRRDVLFRTATEAGVVTARLPSIAKDIDSRFSVVGAGPMTDFYADATAPTRFYLSLLGVFAALGVATAGVGLYGVLSFTVSRRVQEIGIRIALGANVAKLRQLVIMDALRPLVVGLALGLGAALALGRYVRSLLFGVGAHDLVTLGLVAVALLLVAAVAAFVPVRRATRMDPLAALRSD